MAEPETESTDISQRAADQVDELAQRLLDARAQAAAEVAAQGPVVLRYRLADRDHDLVDQRGQPGAQLVGELAG